MRFNYIEKKKKERERKENMTLRSSCQLLKFNDSSIKIQCYYSMRDKSNYTQKI